MTRIHYLRILLELSKKFTFIEITSHFRAFHSSCQLLSQLFSVGGSAGSELDVEVFDQHKMRWTSLKKAAPR